MARFLLFLLVIALVPRGASAATEAIDFGRYHALVVGINDYEHLPNLETAVNDASAVHDLLRRDYGFKSTLLLNPTRYAHVRALDRLRAELTPRDNLLIYYAGHGILDEETDDGYWLPADAEPDSQANWVAIPAVTRTVKAMSAKHVLVVSDSCYSGTLVREVPALLATGADRAAELRRIASRRARKALTSGALEPVADGGGDGHSVFARAFLDALRANREVLDGHSLYTGLRRSVIVAAPQTPKYSDIRFAGDEGGDFLFVPVRLDLSATLQQPAAAPAPAPMDPKTLELSFWESIKDSDDPAVFQAYLDQFPGGVFTQLAALRIDALTRAAIAAASPPKTPDAAPAPAPMDPKTLELSFWESIKDSDDPAVFQAYLDQFPGGVFTQLAALRIDALTRAAIAAASPPKAPDAAPSSQNQNPPQEPEIAALDASDLAGLEGRWDVDITSTGGGAYCNRIVIQDLVVKEGAVRTEAGYITASDVAEAHYVYRGELGPDGAFVLYGPSTEQRIEGRLESRSGAGHYQGFSPPAVAVANDLPPCGRCLDFQQSRVGAAGTGGRDAPVLGRVGRHQFRCAMPSNQARSILP